VILAIRQAASREAIALPFPMQQMLVHERTEESDATRIRRREGWPAGETPPQPRAS
jgi:hypothetical protein